MFAAVREQAMAERVGVADAELAGTTTLKAHFGFPPLYSSPSKCTVAPLV